MSKVTKEEYSCDNCGKPLPTFDNHVVIVTSKDEHSIGWSRLNVTINHHHGSHNDGKQEPADLCKRCVILLLKDALERVQKGERLSAGVSGINMLKFDEAF